jgi:molybdopterin converting factor small subunit
MKETGAAVAGQEVRVRIRYLSAVRDATGKRQDELELPAGSRLAAVADWLKRSYGLAVPGPSLMSTINGYGWNQVPQGLATELHTGDEIALFPLLSGG